MGDEEETERKYELYVKDSDKPREEGSQRYTGYGRAFYVDGEANPSDTYEGQYVEGLRKGKGTYTWKKNGDSYDGHWNENRKHGFGKMTYSTKTGEEEGDAEPEEGAPLRGGTYLGHYTAGLRGCNARADPADTPTSEGTFSYCNGDVYVGQWVAGKKHGAGTYTYAKDQTKLVGDWEQGKIKSGKWVFPNGTFYTGSFRYNKPHGKGVWVFKNGNQLTGEYVQKEQGDEEEAAADDEDPLAQKKDPKVWVYFKHGKDTAVKGGALFKQEA